MRMRKAVITIEVETTLSGAELRGVQALVFGKVRRTDSRKRGSRSTIRREIPKWVGNDTQGIIKQVQVNVVDRASRAKKAG